MKNSFRLKAMGSVGRPGWRVSRRIDSGFWSDGYIDNEETVAYLRSMIVQYRLTDVYSR